MKTVQLILFSAIFMATANAQLTNESPDQDFAFLEGPVWDGSEFLYFTDILNDAIIKYSVTEKTFIPITTASERGNGLMFNSNRNLVVCEGRLGRMTERTINGELLRTVVSEYESARFNSTNDLCIDAKGGIYFSDPNFGNGPVFQPVNRVYYLDKNGTVTAQIDDITKPNGVLLSNDGSILYVSDTFTDKVRAHDVEEDGSLSNGRVFGTLQLGAGGPTNTGADGMATDVEGNLYVTSEAGVQVFDKNGVRLEVIAVPEKSTNCTFGGADKKTLYITAGKNLYAMPSSVKGFHHPFDLPNFGVLSVDKIFPKSFFIANPVIGRVAVLKHKKNLNVQSFTFALFNLQGKKVAAPRASFQDGATLLTFDKSLNNNTYLLKINGGRNTITKKLVFR